MTPLANHIAKILTTKKTRWPELFVINERFLRIALSDIHCFEVTQIQPLLDEVIGSLMAREISEREDVIGRFVFLPAPKTWIEYNSPLIGRIALLLHELKDGQTARVDFLTKDRCGTLGHISTVSPDYETYAGIINVPDVIYNNHELREHFQSEMVSRAHMYLLMINSPKIIGRRQFMPNIALERRMTRCFGVGKFPLHAWTELKLHVAKPIEIDDGEPHEAHLTGKRALHFCRKHIRIRNGKLEYVSAHWRGDASLGIKQKRYSVCP